MSKSKDEGKRGLQITKSITSIKQMMLFQGEDIHFFNTIKMKQAYRSCRYPNQEIRECLKEKIFTQRLPFTVQMVIKARDMLWNDSWRREDCDHKAIYLCIAIAFDTGRRIGQLTHKDGREAEDHCIRTQDVHLVFMSDSTTVPMGSSLRGKMLTEGIGVQKVTHVQLHFQTQKEGYHNTVLLKPPLVIGRNS
jgi:hypothetical protein